MVDARFFGNEEPSFKARQLFFQQKLDTVSIYKILVFSGKMVYNHGVQSVNNPI